MHEVHVLLARQCGVISREQLLGCGVTPTVIRRRLRRRDLVVATPGVYVDHTGELTWLQRAWVAVLALEPAALCHRSALELDSASVDRSLPLHVAVDRSRSPAAPPGVRLHRLSHLQSKVAWNLSPPRVRAEHAVLDVAAECARELDAIAVLADAVQSRRTTAARMLVTLGERPRIARRGFLHTVLEDVEAGTNSVLEHAYLTRVERPHGLPVGVRQVRDLARGPTRDVGYPAQRTYVELDGRLFHDSARARDADLERDLDAATDDQVTLRLGWAQVLGRACATAAKVGAILGRRGWDGTPTRCEACGEA